MTRTRILIADDDPSVAGLLEAMLAACGYESETARDGEEVLVKAVSYEPDLILLDVMMPKKDGYEVLRVLRADRKTMDIPVIMVTGKADIPDKVAGLHLGAGDYLTKPFSTDELIARIKVHLKGRKGTEEKVRTEKLLALSTMIDGMAHEVRNPVTVIGGFTKILLKKTPPDDPRYRYVKAISTEVDRLQRMINDIYRLKTMTLKRRVLFSANRLVRQVLQAKTGSLSARRIILSLDLEPGETKLLVDPAHFKKGLANIVQNAIDAMPGGGKLTIMTRLAPEHYHIHFMDTGCGIREEHLRFIFDPFFTSKMEGTGLGLTFALKVLQDHGGTISVRSTPGIGTQVVVECPLPEKPSDPL